MKRGPYRKYLGDAWMRNCVDYRVGIWSKYQYENQFTMTCYFQPFDYDLWLD